jgi:hypothetical protein
MTNLLLSTISWGLAALDPSHPAAALNPSDPAGFCGL